MHNFKNFVKEKNNIARHQQQQKYNMAKHALISLMMRQMLAVGVIEGIRLKLEEEFFVEVVDQRGGYGESKCMILSLIDRNVFNLLDGSNFVMI